MIPAGLEPGIPASLTILQTHTSFVIKPIVYICRVDTGDGLGTKISAIQKKTQELLDALGIELIRKN